MTDYLDMARWYWASLVSVASVMAGSLGWLTGENVITAFGVVIAVLTVIERIYTIRIKRKQQRMQDIEFDRVTKKK